MNKISKNKAFTLIEVLIVTAVISLIASVVNAQMGEARQKAEDTHMKTETQQVRNAVEQYRQRTGSVPIPQRPESSDYTGTMVSEGTDEYESAMQQLVDEKLMPSIPTSPSGQSYSYLATDDKKEAVFAAVLNDDDSSEGSGGSSTNRCEVVEKSVNFESCVSQLEHSCPDVIDEDIEICINSQYASDNCEYDYSNCEWVTTDPNLMSDYYCQHFATYDHCNEIGWAGPPPPIVCEYTGSVCSGGSNSDYCSCI